MKLMKINAKVWVGGRGGGSAGGAGEGPRRDPAHTTSADTPHIHGHASLTGCEFKGCAPAADPKSFVVLPCVSVFVMEILPLGLAAVAVMALVRALACLCLC